MKKILTYKPDLRVTILTGKSNTGTPTEIQQIFTMECTQTLAPAVGSCTIIFADPSGTFRNTFKPNDIIRIYIASPTGPLSTSPSWTGMVNRCGEYLDPTNKYGRACIITGSTFWKWMLTTAVPLHYFLTGQYPTGNLSLTSIIDTAIDSVRENTTWSIDKVFSTLPNEATTPAWTIPDDFINPQYQSWASFLTSMVIVTGVEVFFNEVGSMVIRPVNYAQPFIDQTINDYEIFKSQNIISDDNLVTVSAVTWSIVGNTPEAAMSPPNGLVDTNPADFVPPEIQQAYRLGKRFVSQTIPFIQDPGIADYYAGIIHAMGLANVNFIDITTCLHGDIRLGTIVNFPMWTKKYYVTQVAHRWYFGRIAETTITGCFGIDTNSQWGDVFRTASPINVPAAYNQSNVLPPVPDCFTRTNAINATSPDNTYFRVGSSQVGSSTINNYNVQSILVNYGSPLATAQIWTGTNYISAANYLWQGSININIDPAFTLGVWTTESSLGKNVTNFNLWGATDSAGNPYSYPDWKTSMDAFFSDVNSQTYASTQTIAAFAAIFNPANPTGEATSITNYTLTYRGGATNPTPLNCNDVTNTPPVTTWDGTQPSGWPLPSQYFTITQGFGPVSCCEPPLPPYPYFHYGIDIACPSGTALYAVMNGTILAGYNNPYQTYGFDSSGDYGYLITITNGPFIVKYGHCQANSLSSNFANGSQVIAGDFIGLSDNTGNSSSPHLHFEIDNPNTGSPQNPFMYCSDKVS